MTKVISVVLLTTYYLADQILFSESTFTEHLSRSIHFYLFIFKVLIKSRSIDTPLSLSLVMDYSSDRVLNATLYYHPLKKALETLLGVLAESC